jgi:hypothetical protein
MRVREGDKQVNSNAVFNHPTKIRQAGRILGKKLDGHMPGTHTTMPCSNPQVERYRPPLTQQQKPYPCRVPRSHVKKPPIQPPLPCQNTPSAPTHQGPNPNSKAHHNQKKKRRNHVAPTNAKLPSTTHREETRIELTAGQVLLAQQPGAL